jgi:hypothetical protein
LGHDDEARNENGNLTSEMRSLVSQRWPQLSAALEETLRELFVPGNAQAQFSSGVAVRL